MVVVVNIKTHNYDETNKTVEYVKGAMLNMLFHCCKNFDGKIIKKETGAKDLYVYETELRFLPI